MVQKQADVKKKLTDLFEQVVESDLKYEVDLNCINYFNLFCKAASKNATYKMVNSDMCLFNYLFEGADAVLMVFSIPINSPEESGQKSIADRVMKIVKLLEDSFVKLDFLQSEEVKEDKFVYVTAVKKINGG